MADPDAIVAAVILALIGTAILITPYAAVRLFIRWLNRRDDPRTAKRPVDPP
jgi:hypothetical protein